MTGDDALSIPEAVKFTHDTGTFAGGAITVNGFAAFAKGTLASQSGAIRVGDKANLDADGQTSLPLGSGAFFRDVPLPLAGCVSRRKHWRGRRVALFPPRMNETARDSTRRRVLRQK